VDFAIGEVCGGDFQSGADPVLEELFIFGGDFGVIVIEVNGASGDASEFFMESGAGELESGFEAAGVWVPVEFEGGGVEGVLVG
jgi:hypothetical protein